MANGNRQSCIYLSVLFVVLAYRAARCGIMLTFAAFDYVYTLQIYTFDSCTCGDCGWYKEWLQAVQYSVHVVCMGGGVLSNAVSYDCLRTAV